MGKKVTQLGAGRNDDKFGLWQSLLKTSLKIPGARVDRVTFLRKELKSHFKTYKVKKAIQTTPAKAGISKRDLEDIANRCIGFHVVGVSTISFATGLPGGWWMIGTIPVDLAQFYWHAVVLSQKLAYLYGWPEFIEKDGEIDDNTVLALTLFIGVMMGAAASSQAIADVAKEFAKQVAKRLPQMSLTKYAGYNLLKQIGRWIGIQITKSSFARGLSKVIPIIGGLISAGMSAAMMIPMANRLKDHLKKLVFAKP